jgi:hypothetical protein
VIIFVKLATTPEGIVDDSLPPKISSPLPSVPQEFASSDFKESRLDRDGTTQAPQQACQSKDQFSLDSRLDLEVSRHGHFECRVVVGIFESTDDGLSSEPMSDRVLTRLAFAFFGYGTFAKLRVTSVCFNLPDRTHGACGWVIGFVSLV